MAKSIEKPPGPLNLIIGADVGANFYSTENTQVTTLSHD